MTIDAYVWWGKAGGEARHIRLADPAWMEIYMRGREGEGQGMSGWLTPHVS